MSEPEQEEGWGAWLRGTRVFGEIHVIRGAIVILALAALVACLHYARAILIPVVLAIFLSYVLGPPVEALQRIRIPIIGRKVPRWFASLSMVLVAMAFATVLSVFIVDELRGFISELPRYEEEFADTLGNARERILAYQQRVESMLSPIRREEAGMPESPAVPQNSGESAVSQLWSSVTTYAFGSIGSLLAFVGQAVMCVFVLFFILLEAPVLKTKIINVMGTSLKRRRIVLEVLHNVNEDLRRYLVTRVVINTILAIIVALVFFAYGLKYAFLIGVLAGVFNFVPYIGPAIGSVVPALIAFMQYGDWKQVVWCVVIYGFFTSVEGNVITPIIMGRHLKLNSLAVLLAAIFWGWLWGPIGLLLAVPIMAVFKAVAEHVDGLRPMGEMLRG